MDGLVQTVAPGMFESSRHFYPRVLNAHIHPLVRFLFSIGNDRIILRYCHLHPEVRPECVRALLERRNQFFTWGGTDLFHVTDEQGARRMMVVETNSCPSGQKSMPLLDESQEAAGYQRLLEGAILPRLERRRTPDGELAVLYDKNIMEASGYAAVLAELTGEEVLLARWDTGDEAVRVVDGVVEVRHNGTWVPIRAAHRYVTQRPWNRLPPVTRTAIFNPVVTCLAGGRNKLVAAKAYDLFNAGIRDAGLEIRTPETIWDVSKNEVPMWVSRMGGVAVVKVPYSNAGQGVYTITCPTELEAFMDTDFVYERFIVQALVGNSGWSSTGRDGRLFHVGTMPNRRGQIFVSDLRFLVANGPNGYFPVSIYARRARAPMEAEIRDGDSWSVLGTNLSKQSERGEWTTESERLLLMDSRDFNQLGVGLDDLIEAYIQTALAMSAIDDMAQRLITSKKRFRRRLFASLNPDPGFEKELC